MTEAEGLKQVLNLAVYGPLGVLAMLGIIVSIKFYLDNRFDRKEHKAELVRVQKEHDEERKEWTAKLEVLAERYNVKADNNIEKYHTLVEGLNRVLDSASRRYPRSGRSAAHGRQDDET
jgi:hypothetical protein